jgi:ankyrin repeat protein
VRNHVKDDLQEILRKYASLDMFEGYEINSPISPGPDGDTPFHIAAYDGNVDAVNVMLPYVNDINLPGDIGNTPLHYAVSGRHLDMVEFLIFNGADFNRGNDYGDTPIDYMSEDKLFSNILLKLKAI